MYEVFEFLDFDHIYKAFFDLNIRFQNLLTHSHLPININLSLKSKTSFESYYKNILVPFQHQIKSLYLSNPFITERIFLSSIDTPLAFARVEKLTLHNIVSIVLEQLLTHFISLSYLFSLDIICRDIVKDERNLYRQIFRLPVLKYCKLLCKHYVSHGSLPVSTNEYSPIEYLVIKHQLKFHEVNALLSYVPRLHRLSLDCKSGSSDHKTVSSSIVLNHLTHVSLNIDHCSFDRLEPMIKHLFHQVQILYIDIGAGDDGTYFDANRWKQLVLTSLPYLRLFDIAISVYKLNSNNNVGHYLSRIDEFSSSFWIERQWFFETADDCDRDGNYDFFLYSTNPYR